MLWATRNRAGAYHGSHRCVSPPCQGAAGEGEEQEAGSGAAPSLARPHSCHQHWPPSFFLLSCGKARFCQFSLSRGRALTGSFDQPPGRQCPPLGYSLAGEGMAHLSADALTLSHQVGTSQHEGRYGQNPACLPFSKPVHVHFPFAETLKGHMKWELGLSCLQLLSIWTTLNFCLFKFIFCNSDMYWRSESRTSPLCFLRCSNKTFTLKSGTPPTSGLIFALIHETIL